MHLFYKTTIRIPIAKHGIFKNFKEYIILVSLLSFILTSFKEPEKEVKRTENFDFGWLFYKGEVQGGQDLNFDDKQWRKVDVPHDWSIEDLPALPNEVKSNLLNIVKGSWKFVKGDSLAYSNPAFNDNTWESVVLPANWENHSKYYDNNAFGWYRREISIPDSLKGQDLSLLLGQIDDADEVYFNGTLIGKTGEFPPNFDGQWQARRKYIVNKDLVKLNGSNIVAIRVFDGGGGGGMYSDAGEIFQNGPFNSMTINGNSTGFTIGGTGWYRKHFKLNKNFSGKRLSVTFDGVYMNSDVWINGHHLGNHPYGYTTFSYDLTNYVKTDGSENVLAVEVKNLGANTRWYSGSGIYRHVWLTTTNPVSVAQWGTSITTTKADNINAVVSIKSTIENKTSQLQNTIVTTTILDNIGTKISIKKTKLELKAGGNAELSTALNVSKPSLWSPENPYLYKVVISVAVNNTETDKTETNFGIRTIEFNPEKGFLLNGKRTILRGGCMPTTMALLEVKHMTEPKNAVFSL